MHQVDGFYYVGVLQLTQNVVFKHNLAEHVYGLDLLFVENLG
eukprot:CAMPEP_0169293362 /NCGR_PEP_ID=MMETSP1016-20121227/63252_1 /TAXON_ID=342587 /ORGANISM="Karlodinium micrum, Strain CCMP2283" /LENGTH=41 /DNA_ID= /DNA_START= /DNA_END= /DNA_ORIENTATION=